MQITLSKALRALALAALISLPFVNAGVRAAATAVSGVTLANLDRTCKPCDDFYQFANGGWIKSHPLPAAYPSYGSFTVLAEHNREVLHGILDAAAAKPGAMGTNSQKIGDFYASCMDVAAIDRGGLRPIAPQLAAIAAYADLKQLPALLSELDYDGSGTFFNFGAGADYKNSSLNIANVVQGGLGLPNKDYYTKTDAASQKLRDAYLAHVTTMFALAGEYPAASAADARSVLAMETALAQASLGAADRRDPQKTDHPTDRAGLQKLTPNFDWARYFGAYPVRIGKINVGEPGFLTAWSQQLGTWKPSQVRAFLKWHLLHSYASALPSAFADANFDFFSRTLQGTKVQQDRWKRCTSATDRILGEALGQFYVAKTFPPSAKASALAMVRNIKATLRDDLATNDWMSAQTKAKAVAKLDAFLLKIGYPDKWRDYSALPIERTSYAGNLVAAARWATKRDLADIGKKVDRSRWGLTPPTVNAYYNPSVNEIVFPAGILQPPFYNAKADPAINYGGIGAVIGHESTHGFDNTGRQFDKDGNLADWWTAADSANFDKRAQCIVDQFDALSPEPGVHEQGKLVQGEAIADLGGLTIAYKAFEKWQSTHPRLTIDGFTPEQRFFLGWAGVWASVDSAQFRTFLANTNEHPWDKFRVNAPLSNMPAFAQAFFCKENDPMVRPAAQRCQIW